MTLAELLVLIAVTALGYRLLRPLQRRLELLLRKWFSAATGKKGQKPVIDVTDYRRKP